ncbi:LysR family transcriptional regulator [Ramlibacter sp. AN1015]|uniref:LysR family transcriptional regulator n=1 Tax=Ramlibacter sp. AN1015 TaxID=3133428 RepID=UPI0030BCB1DA
MPKNHPLTFKQIEAFRAIANHGSFAAAAKKLWATQPAISKRIAEMESALGVELLSRSHSGVQLTQHGAELLEMCNEMLLLRERMVKALGKPSAFKGDFRFGVTELGALTFLPVLVPEIRRSIPEASLHPEVGLSRALLAKLVEGTLDLIVLPMRPAGPKIRQMELAHVKFAWMCSPEMDIPARLPVSQLPRYPLLGQSPDSGLQRTINAWLKANGVSAPKFMLVSNSVSVLSSLSVAGLGLSCLPVEQFKHHVKDNRLKIVQTDPAPPQVTYYIGYRDDALSSISSIVANLIRSAGKL